MNAKEVISEITTQIQKNANVRVVFGEPIDKGAITIIPVAKVVVKGGGGGGIGCPGGSVSLSAGFISQAQSQPQRSNPVEASLEDTNENKEKSKPSSSGGGMGMGLQIETIPLGYIEIKDGQARFKEIEDTTKVALAGIMLAAFMFFSISRMVTTIARMSQHKAKKIQKKIPEAPKK